MNNSSIKVPIIVDEMGVKRLGIAVFKGDGIDKLLAKMAKSAKHAELYKH